MLGHALGAFLPGVQYLLFGAVMLGVVVDQPSFLHLFKHSLVNERLHLFRCRSDVGQHGATWYETVREPVPAQREGHAVHANGIGAAHAHEVTYLVVVVEAVHELHVAASSHRLISSCDSVVVHRIQSFFEFLQAWWGPRQNPNIFHHMLPNRL